MSNLSPEATEALQEELKALKKENRALARNLKEKEYLISSYEQYTAFQNTLSEAQRKKNEEQDTYLRLILENTPDIFLALDTAQKCILGTVNSLKKLGVNTDSLIGQSFAVVFAPILNEAEAEHISADIADTIETGNPKKYNKYTVNTKTGVYYFEINICAFKDTADKIIGAMILFHNETDVQEALEFAENSNKAKSNFLAKMSHEIRTPMNAVLGMAELIIREGSGDSITEHALSIKQAGANLMSIINDILDFSKIESGKFEIIPVDYTFAEMLNDIISIIRMRVIDKQILFAVTTDCNIPAKLIGDEVRIRQILLNLLSNACKFCDNGYISLFVVSEIIGDGEVMLTFEVSDTGIGIKEQDIDKLFGDFVQLDKRLNIGIEGTGLGLVITKGLCLAMNGDISVTSVYGEGSTFTVIIPQKFTEYKKFADIENPDSVDVLVYEPREAYASSIVFALENLGVFYTHVHDQQTFLTQLHKNIYSHVFVSSFLFEATERIIKQKGMDVVLVLLAEYGENVVSTKTIKTLEMPVHSISIANLINNISDFRYREKLNDDIRFTAPSARALIVDDIVTNLKVAEGLLSPYKMKIDVCQSGEEAIAFVSEIEYDIIFMDHMMPEMDGVETTLRIRALEGDYYKNVPIVALTANAITGAREVFLRNGFNDFIAKPIELIKLHTVLETWLPKSKRIVSSDNDNEQKDAASFTIDSIDVKTGIFMTGGSEENYIKTLATYYKDGLDRIPQLMDCCRDGDIALYTTFVHALKSASSSIGANKIASFAKALETAGHNNNLEYIRDNNMSFVAELRHLLDNINIVLSSYRSKTQTGDAALLKPSLKALKDALTDLDMESADEALAKIRTLTIDNEVAEKIDEIANSILICEYDDAIKQAEEIIEVL